MLLHPLDSGVPANSSAQVSWAQEAGRLSVLAELQAGAENLKAEFTGGKTGQPLPRWEFLSRLQHQIKVLVESGLANSMQARAHYQVQDYCDHLLFSFGLVLILIMN